MSDDRMISIREAASAGIDRVRKPIWANPFDHVYFQVRDGKMLGIWVHLYAPFNMECNGRDPVDIALLRDSELDSREFVPYLGPLPDSDEYKAASAAFAGALSK